MKSYLGVVGVLALVAFLYVKFKGLFFKGKDANLVKEDQALKDKQTTLEQQIKQTKEEIANHPVVTMPEEIEAFWNKKK